MIKSGARVLAVGAAAFALMVPAAGIADAGPNFRAPARTLKVVAVSVGGMTYAAVTNAVAGYVCRSWPEGPYVGATDEFGQVIVSPLGAAVVVLPGSRTREVGFTCGPQHGPFTDTGDAQVFVGS
ncbi:hypothetical protein G4X40_11085 [Rhodococcus sp. D2-41]|uniref:Uncharacterized protein n=1 Tax=Speluncibacter jeojiensis TaxID=2710754 RepID=A0A9X4LWV2_9ACTN|nr:hypothetical protein [Rhodococcus sp. D2-41]MDG3010693.1 hypothetical protein [Rhodococcus sp. D2-41]MDG3013674.1 hypothetical protein [Corynebacteriales bacterium D3-21]